MLVPIACALISSTCLVLGMWYRTPVHIGVVHTAKLKCRSGYTAWGYGQDQGDATQCAMDVHDRMCGCCNYLVLYDRRTA